MYFEVVIKEKIKNEKGGVKTSNLSYIVIAESVTDVEVIVNKQYVNTSIEFEITSVKQKKIVDILTKDS